MGNGERPVALEGVGVDYHQPRGQSCLVIGPTNYLVLDIETVVDPELPVETDSEGLPPPPHHQVVCIGVLWFGRDHLVKRMGIIGEQPGEESEEPASEADMLEDFARFMEKHQPTLVTFNGRGFDMPVIAARCLRHGLAFRHYYRDRDVRYRFSPDGHLDLMDYLSDFGAAKRTRLDVSAKLCGMPGKVGVAGKDVGPMIHAGRLAEVRAYCVCDVVQTAGVFLRTQLLRGELDRDRYLIAMRSLMQASLEDERVRDVCARWDAERLLLGEPLEVEPLGTDQGAAVPVMAQPNPATDDVDPLGEELPPAEVQEG